jgi:hypothetical protein
MRSMRAKGSFSGLLAIFLLAMTSWSSACDLSCSLANRHLGCEASQVAQPPQMAEAHNSMTDMENCPHATSSLPGVASGEQAAAPTVAAAPCLHEACRQIAVSTAARRTAQHARRTAARWAAVAMIQPAAPSGLFQPMGREDPPPKTSPLALLSTSLRI